MTGFGQKVYSAKAISNFRYRVYNIVMAIGCGKTLTYAEVARLAGNSKAARAVGNILNKNHDHNIPCHRVIRSDGKTGGYNRGPKLKAKLLREESKNMVTNT